MAASEPDTKRRNTRMAHYQRITAASPAEALRLAEEVLTARIPIEKAAEDKHSITLSGGDGTVTIDVHRHGQDTTVTATTDQLRTSRLDLETQYYLNKLPYQPGDRPTR
jgi:hypothetical protein